MIHAIYWNIGQKTVNQDSISLQQVLCRKGRVTMGLVADGIGGLAEGETASGYVAEELTDWFYKEAVCYHANIGFKRKHRELIRSLNRKVHQMGERLKQYGEQKQIQLGTTCVCLLLYEKYFLLMHIGDCNVYYGKGKTIKRLTEPHVERNGAVNKCIGSMGFYEPDYFIGKVARHGSMLLCSDGFWKQGEKHFKGMLRPKDMQDSKGMERRLKLIGEKNLQEGTKDNQSAVYLSW